MSLRPHRHTAWMWCTRGGAIDVNTNRQTLHTRASPLFLVVINAPLREGPRRRGGADEGRDEEGPAVVGCREGEGCKRPPWLLVVLLLLLLLLRRSALALAFAAVV